MTGNWGFFLFNVAQSNKEVYALKFAFNGYVLEDAIMSDIY
ncbi:hypothetical protein [Sporosarcina psychrophila]